MPMYGLWKYIRSMFAQAANSTPTQPFIHELIERSQEEKASLKLWKDMHVCRKLLDWVQHQYLLYCSLPEENDDWIDFLHTPSSRGFVLHFYKTNYVRQEVLQLFDLFKERVLGTGYRTQISDRRIYQHHDWMETTERHYLKPKPEFGAPGKVRQRYGNITILLILRDDKPYQLKFQATTYRDHLFLDPDDFAELMQQLTA